MKLSNCTPGTTACKIKYDDQRILRRTDNTHLRARELRSLTNNLLYRIQEIALRRHFPSGTDGEHTSLKDTVSGRVHESKYTGAHFCGN